MRPTENFSSPPPEAPPPQGVPPVASPQSPPPEPQGVPPKATPQQAGDEPPTRSAQPPVLAGVKKTPMAQPQLGYASRQGPSLGEGG